MTCEVCGKPIGFWSRLRADAAHPVCKDCHEQGINALRTLIAAVGGAHNFQKDNSELCVARFETTIQKYRLSGPESESFRFALLDTIFRSVEDQEVMRETELNYVVELAHRYNLSASSSPQVLDTVFRLGLREAIQALEQGEPPQTNCNQLVLQRGEICHWEESAGLRVLRTRRQYVGGYSSISIPVPLVRGMRYRVGSFRGHPIDETVLEEGGAGILHITNQRVCFTGPTKSVAVSYKKAISIGGFDRGLIVQTDNEKKPGIFIVRHPELTLQLLNLAAAPPSTSKRANPHRRPALLT